jgi:hypothetical protein
MFDYTTRDKNGALLRGTIQATDRSAALKLLQAKDLIPISVTDSLGQGSGMGFPSRPSYRVMAIMIAAVLVISSLLIAWWVVSGNRNQKTNMAKVNQPILVQKGKPSSSAKVSAQEVPVAKTVQTNVSDTNVIVFSERSKQGQTMISTTNPPARRAGVRVLTKDGKEVFHPRDEIKTQTDRFLWAVVNSKGTKYIPVSITHVERDFEKALKEKILILNTDTPEDVANKAKIEQVKQEINEMLKQGNKLPDIIRAIQEDQNTATALRREVREKLFTLIKEGNIEEATKFQKDVNIELEVDQIEPVFAPPKLLEMGVEKAEEKNSDRKSL